MHRSDDGGVRNDLSEPERACSNGRRKRPPPLLGERDDGIAHETRLQGSGCRQICRPMILFGRDRGR
jgi:hypothetical protein